MTNSNDCKPLEPADWVGKPIDEVLRKVAKRLASSGIEQAWLEADLLLGKILGWDRAELYAHSDLTLSKIQADNLGNLLLQRLAKKPFSYVVEERWFYSFDFVVGPGVFVPRPETEELVDEVVEMTSTLPKEELRIWDVGTGSGNIAITLAHILPQATIFASDISPVALDYARRNLARLKGAVHLFASDLEQALRKGTKFHIIVSNPPYIPRRSIPFLPPEVQCEPTIALDGGEDGLDFYRRLAKLAEVYLVAGGYLIMELGAGMFNSVAEILGTTHWHNLKMTRDAAGHERVIAAQFCPPYAEGVK